MISETCIQAIKIQKAIFGYMPHYPFQWNSTFTGIEFSAKSPWRLIPWFTFLFLLFLSGVLCGYGSIYFTQINPRPDFNLINLTCLLGCSGLAIGASLIFHDLLRKYKIYLPVINDLFHLERKCISVYGHITMSVNQQPSSQIEFFLIIGSISFGIIPIVAVANSIILNLDVYYWLFDEYILTSPMYRSSVEICVSILVRCALLSPAFFEGLRSACFGMTLCLLAGEAMASVLKTIACRVRNVRVSRMMYIELTIIFRNASVLLNAGLYILLNMPFWLIVFSVWINVKAVSRSTLELRIMFLGLSILMSVLVLVLLPKFVWLADSFERVLVQQKYQAWRFWKHRKTRKAKICWKESEALCKIPIKYGLFVNITEGFTNEYFYTLTLRIFDAILIFDMK